MGDETFAKCRCDGCGTHLEFALVDADTVVDCPSCELPVRLSPEGSEIPDAPSRLTQADIASAFGGPVPKTHVSLLYQFGLVFVTLAMVVLPLIYLALIAGVGWLTWIWATGFTPGLTGSGGGRLLFAKFLLYLTPLLTGVTVLLFMIKPLLAARRSRAQPLALNPGAEPLIFGLVHRLCQTIGAPTPNRIDVDCQLNASAGFRRGLFSFFGNDLVLTIGLPLVAGLTAREFTGVLAHEFGHFTQGFGLRLTYIIRRINHWFARVVYERDAWDVWLEECASEADFRIQIIVGVARFAVWISRGVLWILMMVGHLIGCFMLRQMEFDADSYEIAVAGSEVFESTTRRMHVLSAVEGESYKKMRVPWNQSKQLPDDFPAYLMKHDSQLRPEQRTQLENTMGLAPSGLLDTHPSTGDRIRQARKAQAPGIFQLDAPATALFGNFTVLSGQVSRLHYEDDLGIPLSLATLKAVDAFGAANTTTAQSPSSVPRTLILPSMRDQPPQNPETDPT
jgi:Zn-dependent protease with chaperone function